MGQAVKKYIQLFWVSWVSFLRREMDLSRPTELAAVVMRDVITILRQDRIDTSPTPKLYYILSDLALNRSPSVQERS